MRESIRERRTFARIAPRFVEPLAFAMPLRRRSRAVHSPCARRWRRMPRLAAIAIEAWPCRAISRPVAWPARQTAAVRWRNRPASAAVWHDYQTVHGDRLTLAFAKAAWSHGARLANYTEATGFLKDGARCDGVTARDNMTGTQFGIRARVIVNAAGPWAAQMLSGAGVETRWPLLKAMNSVTSRPARKAALVAPTRAGRALVLLPWQGRTLVGTKRIARWAAAGRSAGPRR